MSEYYSDAFAIRPFITDSVTIHVSLSINSTSLSGFFFCFLFLSFAFQAETQHEVRLRDIQLSLERSQSHAQRLQHYVDFLKASYAAMFEDTLATNAGGAYHFK